MSIAVPQRLTHDRLRAFIFDNTDVVAPPHVPEISLRLATEAHGLWLKTEAELDAIGLPPPYWAFAWAGGQGLARYVLDHPEEVAGRTVLDFASGSGLVAIAAAKAGAAAVTAADIDPFCREAIAINAAVNGVDLSIAIADAIGRPVTVDVLLAGDVFFDRAMSAAIRPWFDSVAAAGTTILVGDPGRSYLPRERLEELATDDVTVTRALEDAEVKRTTVWRWRTGEGCDPGGRAATARSGTRTPVAAGGRRKKSASGARQSRHPGLEPGSIPNRRT